MLNSKSVIENIKKRTSQRTFEKIPLTENQTKIIEDMISGEQIGPFGNKARFRLIQSTPGDSEPLKGLGTYGFIKNPQAFIIGAITAAPFCMEDYGYLLEKIILQATGESLGTCWLGGSFSKSKFAQKINLQDNEILPAITPIGVVKDKRSLTDKFIRMSAKSHSRKPCNELFFEGDLASPLDMDNCKYQKVLEMVRLAPSASNRQPWIIINENESDIFHLYLKRNKIYKKSLNTLKLADLQKIDMGIAICHFNLTAQELKLEGRWQIDNNVKIPQELEYIATWK